MGINPFKDSNLDDLQQNISGFLYSRFGGLLRSLREKRRRFTAKGKERITVMFIPHTEKKIINFHISIFAISFFVGTLILTIVITSIFIVNHSSTIKQVSKLKTYGTNSKLQVQKYKEEIGRFHSIFQTFKPEITHLYSLTPGSNIDSLWARGGVHSDEAARESGELTPPMELLDFQQIETELKTSREIIGQIKEFLSYRKKIIENTPSIWPVDGYIISRFGNRNSPYTFRPEYHAGIDIEAFPGSEIRATAPGKVEDIFWDSNLGLTVTVRHKYGFTTHYSHCERVTVEKDQKISKGEVVGYVGRTGKTTRYMCYYQIKIGTEFVDPIPYLNRIMH